MAEKPSQIPQMPLKSQSNAVQIVMNLSSDPRYEFGSFLLAPSERLLLRAGEPVALTRKTFDLLLLLIERREQVVEKDELLRQLWPDSIVEEANLSQTVYMLRKTLSAGADAQAYVKTIPGRGYRFVAPVRVIGGAAPEEMAEQELAEATATVTAPVAELGNPARRRLLRGASVAVLIIGLMGMAVYLAGARWPRKGVAEPVARMNDRQAPLPARRETSNREARELYLRGRFFWNQRTNEALTKAAGYFQQAIALDSNYAIAHAGLADCYLLMARVLPAKDAYLRGKTAALRALELDGELAEAHAAFAFATWRADYDWATAEREFRRALELDPNYVTAWYWHGLFLTAQARFDEARAALLRAVELDPLSLAVHTDLAAVSAYARQYEQFLTQTQKMLELYPDHPHALAQLAAAQAHLGNFAAAVELIERTDRLEPAPARLAHVYGLAGQPAQARQALARAFAQPPMDAGAIARVYADLNETEEAFRWLERGYEERSSLICFLKVHPSFDPLRADPRFAALLRRVGLEK